MTDKFRFIPQEIPEVLLIEHKVFGDDRGMFTEVFREGDFAEAGLPRFVQENHSRSARDVLRGLHYQNPPQAVGKLVRCLRGEIFDVAVDIRKGSPTFGRSVGVTLREGVPHLFYVPPGFAHGFCVLSDTADVIYKQTGYYSPAHEGAIRFDDPKLAIAWPVQNPVLSEKDKSAKSLASSGNLFVYGATS